MFKSITLEKWQQFEEITINFHDQLTIITGANGAGKTTILNILAKHNSWRSNVYATPKLDAVTGVVRFFTRLFGGKAISDSNTIGTIGYVNGQNAILSIDNTEDATTNISISNMQNVPCFYIPSHRSVYRYQKLRSIPTEKKMRNQAFNEVFNSTVSRYFDNHTQSVSYLMKNTLIGWLINGYGVSNGIKQVMPRDEEQIRNFEGFQDILRKVLPKTLGFQEIEIRNSEIVFVCNDGKDEFLLETASGGISSIIDLAWQIFMYSYGHDEFVVLIDEVENHLHPIMQRKILTDFISAFPKTCFIVSTHSPLVVSSVKESKIYALSYNDKGKIVSKELDFTNNVSTANEILENILGLTTTLPVWAQEKLDEIINEFKSKYDEPDFIKEFSISLSNAGLSKFAPQAITGLLQ